MSTPTNRPQSTALRAALDEARPRHMAQDALSLDEANTRPQLEALAARLETTHAQLLMGGQSVEHRSHVGLSALDDLRRAAAVVLAAARYGYPRPPLEALGAQAGHLPAARTTDPATARDAGETARLVPSTRNQLGRLLTAFRGAEKIDSSPAMTSEEAAHRAGISPTAEYAKRCSDLAQLGYIRVAQDDDGHDRTRKGRAGLQRLVFELTPDGRRLADDLIVRRG